MYCDCPELTRCCCCLPLRRGILVFGYVKFIFSAFMLGVYSFSVHHERRLASGSVPEELSVLLYCLQLVFTSMLIYGAHFKHLKYIRVYYYFSIAGLVAGLLMHIFTIINTRLLTRLIMEIVPMLFLVYCIQIYLIILIRSLLKKLEYSGPNVYENRLQWIVYERKNDINGVYNDTTVVPIDV